MKVGVASLIYAGIMRIGVTTVKKEKENDRADYCPDCSFLP